jgi:hypothetical protein
LEQNIFVIYICSVERLTKNNLQIPLIMKNLVYNFNNTTQGLNKAGKIAVLFILAVIVCGALLMAAQIFTGNIPNKIEY